MAFQVACLCRCGRKHQEDADNIRNRKTGAADAFEQLGARPMREGRGGRQGGFAPQGAADVLYGNVSRVLTVCLPKSMMQSINFKLRELSPLWDGLKEGMDLSKVEW